MPQLILNTGSAPETVEDHLRATLRAGFRLDLLEFPVGRSYAFAAVRHPDGRVRALVVYYEAVTVLSERYVALEAPVREETNPDPVDLNPAFFRLLTPLGGLFAVSPGAESWRARVSAWHDHLKANSQGQVLLGDYGGPGQYGDDTLGYNEHGKERFRKDALRYLKCLQKELGWAGKPCFNASGVAGSGDATVHLMSPDAQHGVYVDIAQGSQVPEVRQSVQGVRLMWRFEHSTAGRSSVGERNQWADWDTHASVLAGRILRQCQLAATPLARAGD